jgi:hypothetical protein
MEGSPDYRYAGSRKVAGSVERWLERRKETRKQGKKEEKGKKKDAEKCYLKKSSANQTCDWPTKRSQETKEQPE